MSTNTKTRATHYEVMVILDPDIEERSVEPSLEKFSSIIRTSGGTVDSVNVWGRRRFAYEIDRRHEGIYVVLDLTCDAEAVSEFDRQLNLSEAVMRTKVLRIENS